MTPRTSRAIATLLALLCVFSCTPEDPARPALYASTETRQTSVIDGTIDDSDLYSEVVYIRNDRTACTGTLIGQRYVLTAAHCVCGLREVDEGQVKYRADGSSCVETVLVKTRLNNRFSSDIVADVFANPEYVQTLDADQFILDSVGDVALLELRSCPSAWAGTADWGRVVLPNSTRTEVAMAGFGAINCSNATTDDRRYGDNSISRMDGEVIEVRKGSGQAIIHVGDSGGPLYDADGVVIGVTSASACNQYALFTQTGSWSDFIESVTSRGASCVEGQETLRNASWLCDADRYSDGTICDCDCGQYDPDCELPYAIAGCSEGETCSRSGVCVVAPASGWHVASEAWDGNTTCDCNGGAVDPDCGEFARSSDCQAKDVCDVRGVCVASGAVVPTGWTCADESYADGVLCDCDCGTFDPDCRDEDVDASTCPTGEFCSRTSTCEPTPVTCDVVRTLVDGQTLVALDLCEQEDSAATACDDSVARDALIGLNLHSAGTWELLISSDGSVDVFGVGSDCTAFDSCEPMQGVSRGSGVVAYELTTAEARQIVVGVQASGACSDVSVSLNSIVIECGQDPEMCDGLDNDCDGDIDEGGSALCPVVPNADVVACQGEEGCAYLCRSGFADVDGAVSNGCEVGASADICDGLDNDGDNLIDEDGPAGCATISNTLPTSCGVGGICEYVCVSGFVDVDGELANGCESAAEGGGGTFLCTSGGAPSGGLLGCVLIALGLLRRRERAGD